MLKIIQFFINLFTVSIREKRLKITYYDFESNVIIVKQTESLFGEGLPTQNVVAIKQTLDQPIYSISTR